MKTCIQCRCEIKQNSWNCLKCGYEPRLKDGILVLSLEFNGQKNIGFEAESFNRLINLGN